MKWLWIEAWAAANFWRVFMPLNLAGLPQEAVPVSKLESGADSPASELAEAERKPG